MINSNKLENSSLFFHYSSSQNKSSKVFPNSLHIARQRFNEGLYFPASIKLIVCLVTLILSASSSCVKSFSTLAIFILIFFMLITYILFVGFFAFIISEIVN